MIHEDLFGKGSLQAGFVLDPELTSPVVFRPLPFRPWTTASPVSPTRDGSAVRSG